jgi:hypothetical protein
LAAVLFDDADSGAGSWFELATPQRIDGFVDRVTAAELGPIRWALLASAIAELLRAPRDELRNGMAPNVNSRGSAGRAPVVRMPDTQSVGSLATRHAIVAGVVGRAAVLVRTARKVAVAVLLAFLALHAGMAGVTAFQYFAGTVRVPGYPANKKFLSEATNLDPVYRVAGDLREPSLFTPTREDARASGQLVRAGAGQLSGPLP